MRSGRNSHDAAARVCRGVLKACAQLKDAAPHRRPPLIYPKKLMEDMVLLKLDGDVDAACRVAYHPPPNSTHLN